MSNTLPIIQKELPAVQQIISTMEIVDSESLIHATTYLSQANKYLDSLVEEREKVTKPLNEALKAERARFKPVETSLNDVISILRAKMAIYQSNLVRAQQQAQAKVAAKVQSGYIKTETAVNKLEAMPVIEKEIATAEGLVQFAEVKKFEVISMKELPIEYHIPNEVDIRREMKLGNELPGVKYWTEQQPRNYR